MSTPSHSIWSVIEHLLYAHDCVIVPGFGGFVCNAEPARMDQVSHVILPPGKHVVFNPNLKTNDGLLIAQFAETKQLSYTEALSQIEQWVRSFVAQLQTEKQIEIQQFGKFRLNAEANIVFIPDATKRYTYESYGLAALHAAPVGARQLRKNTTRMFRELAPATSGKNRVRSGSRWQQVLLATVVLLTFINGWIYFARPDVQTLHDTGMSMVAWFDTLRHGTEQQQHAPIHNKPSQPGPVSIPDSKPALPGIDHIAQALQSKMLPPAYSEAEPKVDGLETARYFVIGGVFCKTTNAERYVQTMQEKGYDAAIVSATADECSRVSIAAFDEREQAEAFLAQAKHDIHPDVWIWAE